MKLKQMILTTAATMLLATPSWAEILVTDAHSFETAKGMSVGIALMTLENNGDKDDLLVSIETPLAANSEIHEMKEEDGIMKMRKLEDGLELPAGQKVVLSSGSYHIMLMGLKEPLTLGSEIPLELVFASGEHKSVKAPVLSRMEKMKEMDGHADHMKHGKMEAETPDTHHEMHHQMMEEKTGDAADHPEHD